VVGINPSSSNNRKIIVTKQGRGEKCNDDVVDHVVADSMIVHAQPTSSTTTAMATVTETTAVKTTTPPPPPTHLLKDMQLQLDDIQRSHRTLQRRTSELTLSREMAVFERHTAKQECVMLRREHTHMEKQQCVLREEIAALQLKLKHAQSDVAAVNVLLDGTQASQRQMQEEMLVLEGRLTCLICYDAPKEMLCHPCRHLCLCLGCSKKLGRQYRAGVTTPFLCPICKTGVDNILRVYPC
jgi:hypothetical protein